MRSENLTLKTRAGEADAYVAAPAGDPAPGVLLLMDAYGLRGQIRGMVQRIAAHGYTVLAPNLFYRAGPAPLTAMPDLTDGEARTEFFGRVRPLMQQLTPEAIAEDGGAYLGQLVEIAPGPVAVVGYCMGARIGLRIAAAYPDRVAALAGFHAGGLVTDDPQSPHRSVAALRAVVYFGHADSDPSMSTEQIAELDRALESGGIQHTTEVYAGARHGYTMADTPAYDQAADRRHLENLLALIERTLRAPAPRRG